MPRSAILCDIGNVIVTFDFGIAARRFAPLSDFGEDAVLTRLDELKIPFEDGQIDDTAFVTEAMKIIGFRGTPADFAHIWCDIFTANACLCATLERVCHHCDLHLLSNTSGLHKDFLFSTFPVFRLFKNGVYSYSARTSKPGRRIFEITIEQLDLDPLQTFYIDDLEPNIATAASLGFTTHHYHKTRHHEFEAALSAWSAQLE